MREFVKVNGVVTEVIESRQVMVNDWGIHRDIERESRIERHEMLNGMRGRYGGRTPSEMREYVDDVLPKQDYYIDNYTKFRVRYQYRGKNWENITETDEACSFHVGTKVKLSIQKVNPQNIQSVSYQDWLYEKVFGVAAVAFLFPILFLFLTGGGI